MWLVLIALGGGAHAAEATDPGRYPIRLVGGLAGSVAAPSAGGLVGGRILAQTRGGLAIDVAAREGLFSADARSVGAIFFGARWTTPTMVHGRLGLSHHHETPWAVLEDDPIASLAGSADGIRHRTGAELGVGWTWRVPESAFKDRLGFTGELSLDWVPDDSGPRLYSFVDLSIDFAVGKARD